MNGLKWLDCFKKDSIDKILRDKNWFKVFDNDDKYYLEMLCTNSYLWIESLDKLSLDDRVRTFSEESLRKLERYGFKREASASSVVFIAISEFKVGGPSVLHSLADLRNYKIREGCSLSELAFVEPDGCIYGFKNYIYMLQENSTFLGGALKYSLKRSNLSLDYFCYLSGVDEMFPDPARCAGVNIKRASDKKCISDLVLVKAASDWKPVNDFEASLDLLSREAVKAEFLKGYLSHGNTITINSKDVKY